MKVLVGAFNQEKALVGAFSVIVKTDSETDGSLYSTNSLHWPGLLGITQGTHSSTNIHHRQPDMSITYRAAMWRRTTRKHQNIISRTGFWSPHLHQNYISSLTILAAAAPVVSMSTVCPRAGW